MIELPELSVRFPDTSEVIPSLELSSCSSNFGLCVRLSKKTGLQSVNFFISNSS